MKTITHRDKPIKLILLILLFGLQAKHVIGQDSVKLRKVRFYTYLGFSKSNYFYSRAPSGIDEFQRGIDNTRPSYSLGIESMIKLPGQFFLGTGINYSTVKFQIYYTHFVNPNLQHGYIGLQLRHDYVSFPLNLYWKVPVSNTSSMFLFVGAESFKSVILRQNKKEYIVAINKNGTFDNYANIQTSYKLERFSPFRIFNAGLKFEFNQFNKNRVAIGFNYYLMRNFFPIENQSNIFIGNKNYESYNNLYFEGLKFTAGYIW